MPQPFLLSFRFFLKILLQTSKSKIKILLQAASKDNWYLEILLGLFCGLRKGEIYGLKFSDFDLENRSVKISRQIVANPIIKEGSRITYDEAHARLQQEAHSAYIAFSKQYS